MSYLPSSPDLANVAGLLTKYPRRGILLFKLLEDIKRSFSPLSKGMRELIITYTSSLNQCDYCYNAHKAVFTELGIDEAVFDQLKNDIGTANVDEKLKPILRYIKKLTLTPHQLTQADAQKIFDAGWDEQAFLDSVCICAVVNCMNRFVTGIGIDQEVGTIRKSAMDLLFDMNSDGWAKA
ncbi:MAG: peroxidase-related enzyme [Methylobacter sp.]|nr:peroxidase-related enzyme [Methylobacter sp.]